MNTSAQHVVDTLEVEKHIIQGKINQVTRHAETPLLQIVKKTVEVPEIQRVPAEVPLLQFTDKVVDIPVVAQRQIRMNRKVQKSVEIPQLRQTDQMVDVPVVVVAQVPLVRVVMKTVETPQLPLVLQVPLVQVVAETAELLSDVQVPQVRRGADS